MKTIIAAVDFSRSTEPVVAEATTLARSLFARIVLLHVTEPVAGVVDFAIVSMNVASVDQEAVARAKKRLELMKEQLTSTGLEVDILEVVGSPGREIVDQAKILSADYIVLGSHGHTAFYDLVMGSATSMVVKHAHCPAVIVPTSPFRRPATIETASPEVTP